MKNVILACLAAILLSACTVHAEPWRFKVPDFLVIDGDHHEGGGKGGKFCPPGQAKKGNC